MGVQQAHREDKESEGDCYRTITFEYTVKVLGLEIERLRVLNGVGHEKIEEIQKAIRVFTDGKGILTHGDMKEKPVQIIMWRDL